MKDRKGTSCTVCIGLSYWGDQTRGAKIATGETYTSNSPAWVVSSEKSSLIQAVQASTIEERIAALPAGPLIVIVPTASQRQELLCAWARFHGIGEPPEIVTMSAFYRTIGNAALDRATRILTDAEADILLQQAARNTGGHSLGMRVNSKRIARWAQEGITINDLVYRAEDAGQPRRQKMMGSVLSIWSAYHNAIGSRASDRGTYAQRVVKALVNSKSFVYRTSSADIINSAVVFDTHGITFVDRELLISLADKGWDIGISFAPEIPPDPDVMVKSRNNADLQWMVSKGWHGRAQADSDERPSAVVCTAITRTKEVRLALSIVKEFAARGEALSGMALCVPGDSSYQRIIEELATACGVPISLNDLTSLAMSRTASALHTACSVVRDGWLRADVERLLGEPLVGRELAHSQSLLQVANSERIAGGNGVEGWQTRIKSRLELAKSLAESSVEESEEWFERSNKLQRAEIALHNLRSCLDLPVNRLIESKTFVEFLDDSLLVGLNLEEADPQATELLRTTFATYRTLCEDHELPSLHLAEHLRAWWLLVVGTPIERKQNRAGLRVCRPAELRGKQHALVLALGCIEGEFPRNSSDVLDEEMTPNLQQQMSFESMCDIATSVPSNGLLFCLYPNKVDGAPVLPSSLLNLVNHVPPPDWLESVKQNAQIILEPRDVQLRTKEPLYVDRSQLGNVVQNLSAEHLEAFDVRRYRATSPSRLDVATGCPYKFFAQKILRLDERGYNDTKLTPLERGLLLHDLVRQFYQSYQGQEGAPTSTQDLLSRRVNLVELGSIDDHWERLQSILQRMLGDADSQHLYADVENRALVGSTKKPGLLYRWLTREMHDQDRTGFLPALFEYEVRTEVPLVIHGGPTPTEVSLRMDRVDVNVENGQVYFVVTDYKATHNSFPTHMSVVRGEASQMPLYISALSIDFQNRGIEALPAGAVYRSFGSVIHAYRDPKSLALLVEPGSSIESLFGGRRVSGVSEKPLIHQIEHILETVGESQEVIESGLYSVTPRGAACVYCPYSELCRVDHWGPYITHE